MNAIVQLVLKIANLAEAEGRAAKRNALRLSTTVILLASAAVLSVAGILVLVAALAVAMINHGVEPAIALMLVAALTFVAAVSFGLWGKSVYTDKPPTEDVKT